jgi:hypothetical protein
MTKPDNQPHSLSDLKTALSRARFWLDYIEEFAEELTDRDRAEGALVAVRGPTPRAGKTSPGQPLPSRGYIFARRRICVSAFLLQVV